MEEHSRVGGLVHHEHWEGQQLGTEHQALLAAMMDGLKYKAM